MALVASGLAERLTVDGEQVASRDINLRSFRYRVDSQVERIGVVAYTVVTVVQIHAAGGMNLSVLIPSVRTARCIGL